jgi:hypothetical protein
VAQKSLGHCRPSGRASGECQHLARFRVVFMADDTSRLEALVARLIQDKLGQEGGLEDLLRAVREVEQSFPARDESGNEGDEPVRVDTAFAGEGTLKGEVNAVVVPTVRATMTLLPPTLVVVPDKGSRSRRMSA